MILTVAPLATGNHAFSQCGVLKCLKCTFLFKKKHTHFLFWPDQCESWHIFAIWIYTEIFSHQYSICNVRGILFMFDFAYKSGLVVVS